MNLPQKKVLSAAVIVIILSVGLLTGCTETTNTTTIPYFPLSTTESTILNDAYARYDSLKNNVSAFDARQQLVQHLNAQAGVDHAELGLDNYTIFITYDTGGLAALDTYDVDEELSLPKIGFSAPTTGMTTQGHSLSKNILMFDGAPTRHQPISEYALGTKLNFDEYENAFDQKITCGSKKVLILGPSYWEYSKEPTDACIQMFRAQGWEETDITLNLNSIPPWYNNTDCLKLQPDDYFKLNNYGIILFVGHGTVKVRKNFNETNLYLEFCYLTDESFGRNTQLQKWYTQHQLLIFRNYTTNSGGTIYATAIRADVLRQYITGSLPSSFVYLSTCYGSYFNKVFLDKGASVFLSWDNSVLASYADNNMKNMVQLMLQRKYNAYDAFINESMIKAYSSSNPENTVRGLVPAIPNTQPHPLNVHFCLYPDPLVSDIPRSFYFPGWFQNITLKNIPVDATAVNITVNDPLGNRRASRQISVSSSTMEVSFLNNFMFSTNQTLTLQVIALDNTGGIISTDKWQGTLSVGPNEHDLDLTKFKDLPHVEYVTGNVGYEQRITIDLSVSSTTWVSGAEITATAVCSCDPVNGESSEHPPLPGFTMELMLSSGTIVSYSPSFVNGSVQGLYYNGRLPTISWSNWWPSPTTFSVTFHLDKKEDGRPSEFDRPPSIVARCAWSNWGDTDWAIIYLI